MTIDLRKVPKKPETVDELWARWGLKPPKRSLRYSEDQPRDEAGRWTAGGIIATTTTYSELSEKGRARVDEKLAKLGVTQQQLHDEILSKVTPETLAAHGDWYEKNHDAIASMADKYGTSMERATAVVAATSPNMVWERNMQAADSILKYTSSGAVDGMTGAEAYAKWADATPTKEGRWNVFSTEGGKAFDVALGNKEPADVLTTAKVSSFYDNLMQPGQTREVTVDRHMLKAFGFATDGQVTLNQAVNIYGSHVAENKVTTVHSVGAVAIAEAVRSASRDLDVPPDAVQATYWSVVLDQAYPGGES